MIRLICSFLLAGIACAQSPAFDVASVKPAPSTSVGPTYIRSAGGPGTKDPGLYTCENCSLADLVVTAFDLKRYQLTAPDWMYQQRFVVTAKIPAGATKESFHEMMQTLLRDRFKLAVHRAQREMAVYDLVVAKGGPRMQQTAAVDSAGDGERRPAFSSGEKPKLDAGGYPVLPQGGGPMTIMMDGRARSRTVGQTADQIAATLANQIGKPVRNKTGLAGKYDFTLSWSESGPRPPASASGDGGVLPPGPEDSAQDIFGAVQSQLGLKLEPSRGPVEMIVVDHAEKVASEN